MQRQAAIYLMVSLVFVGIPIGIVFAFPLKLGLQGLWLGTAVGFTFEMLSFLKIIWQADWIKVAAETARKMEEAKQEIELK